jgi:peroxiredoxin Q/BCP
MPRKASTEAPRRSTRISSQPQQEVKEKKPRASKAGTKRGAAENEETKTASKKAKAETDEPAAAEDGEEMGSDTELDKIDIGDSLASLTLTLKNEQDDDVDVATLTAEKGVVLFLVPKADTPGCTNQACGFRDIYPDFTSLDFDVYCLSADTSAAQLKWQTKKNLPYPLLSDRKRLLIGALGAAEGGKTKRSHFIFERGGKLVDKKLPAKPADSPKQALDFVKGLKQSV